MPPFESAMQYSTRSQRPTGVYFPSFSGVIVAFVMLESEKKSQAEQSDGWFAFSRLQRWRRRTAGRRRGARPPSAARRRPPLCMALSVAVGRR